MSNPFLTKKDPVLESVKAAMQDGEFRRQAEALVNEEFGVYSRKAVIREQLAAYDARLEEAYKCMKEGKPLADKDYDKDGKVESPKDEVWGSRFRAAKMAGKMEEEQIDELKAPTAKTAHDAYRRAERSDDEMGNWDRSNRLYGNLKKKYPGKSARNQKDTGKADLPTTGNVEFHKAGYSGHVTKKGKLTKSATKDTKTDIKSRLGRHTKPNLPEEIDYSAQDRAPVTKSPKGYEDPSTPKVPYSELPKTQNRAGAVIDSAKGALKEDEQIDEISQATVRSYIDKAHARATAAKSAGFKKDYSEKKGKKAEKARGEFGKRTKGLGMAGKKLAEEEQIDEISKELAGRYVKKAHYAGGMTDFKHGKIYGQELAKKGKTKESPWKKDLAKTSQKREAGIETAVNKLTGKAKVAANEEAMNEAKAGRAGAILAKIRAKHMKEDQSF